MGSMVDDLFRLYGSPVLNMTAGRAITYRQRNGVEFTPTAVFERKSVATTNASAAGDYEEKGCMIWMTRQEAINFGREPKRGDEADVEGETFIVDDVKSEGEDWFELTCALKKKVYTSGESLRRKDEG